MALISISSFGKLFDRKIKSTLISKTFENNFDNHKKHEFMKNGPNFIFNYFAATIPFDEEKWVHPSFFSMEIVQVNRLTTEENQSTIAFSEVPFERCNEREVLKSYGNLLIAPTPSICFKYNNSTIFGSDMTENSRILARFGVWNSENRTWYPEEDLRKLLYRARFRMYILNKHYDFMDFENPLKTYVDDHIFERLDFGFLKMRKVLIRENRVIQYDSIWPWASPTEYTFYSVSNTVSIVANSTEEKFDELAQFVITPDPQIGIVYPRLTI
jgi:hypothetical protein